jgi:2-phospho-L-lactate guanylyltransferase
MNIPLRGGPINTSGVWAVVPVKTFANAKSRLSAALPPEARRRLAQAMFEDVLDALGAARGLTGIAVVTVDPVARQVATIAGARVIDLFAQEGHTIAVNGAAALLASEGAEAVVTMPGDIPRVTAEEIATVIEARTGDREFIIVPAHDRRGSNTILSSPPGVVPLQFGNDSFLPHLAAARAIGIEPRVLQLPGIGQDIDNPEDLEAFMRTPSPTRTFALLEEILASEKTCR